MYRRHLTAEFVRAILDYDPKTGVFRWRHRADRARNWNTRYAGQPAGQVSNGYVCIQIDGKGGYYAGPLAWLMTFGEWPPDQIDHIDGDRQNNRIDNLRLATHAENNANKSVQRNNSSSGLRGVSYEKQIGRWRARITVDGNNYSLGCYGTKEEAQLARDAAAKRLLGAFARPADSPPPAPFPRPRRR